MVGRYFKRVFVSLDILLNVVVLFGGVETVSSRCGKRLVPVPVKRCRLCGALCDLIDRAFNGRWKDHCINNRMGNP